MLRLVTVLVTALSAVTGCTSSVVSQTGLLSGDPQALRAGVWAILEPGCRVPQSNAASAAWPNCAYPLRVHESTTSLQFSDLPQALYMIDRRHPDILQVQAADGGSGDPRFYYFGLQVRTGDIGSAREFLVWRATCPTNDDATAGDAGCLVTDLAEVRRRAMASRAAGPVFRAVWMDPSSAR